MRPRQHHFHPDNSRAHPSASPSSGGKTIYIFRLFVAGVTDKSGRAIVNIRRVCEEYLLGRYSLEIVDLLQNPEAAAKEQIIAAPTLIKTSPEPKRRFIGDLSDPDRFVQGLDLTVEDLQSR